MAMQCSLPRAHRRGYCNGIKTVAPSIKAPSRGSLVCVRAGIDLSSVATHDLIACKQPEQPGFRGNEEFCEVTQGYCSETSSITVSWKGRLCRLAQQAGQQGLQLTPLGPAVTPDNPVARAFPPYQQWLQSPQAAALPPPPAMLASARVVYSLSRLEADVTANPAPWVAGTKPGDPPLTALQDAVLGAGELAALMAGHRGLVSVQLWNGWDASLGQPLHRPFVTTLLSRALGLPDFTAVSSPAPEGLGLTALVAVNREPWTAYAKHLASFGFQAAIVAGSPYYKMLIGRLLGYAEENVRAYVAASSPPGSLTPAVIAQVEADMRKLSRAKPKLPWNVAISSRGKGAKHQGAGAAQQGKGASRVR